MDGELLWARTVLTDAGIDSARADAEWLMAATLGVDRGRLLILDDIDPAAARRFRAAVSRRAARIPLQHIVGTASFGPAELSVGPGVFTPRPETEFLVEWAMRHVPRDTDVRIVDLCSGSGALAIAIATLAPNARMWAVERSPEALEWLRRNVDDAPGDVSERVVVVAADVTDASAVGAAIDPGSIDIVVTNPPYVPTTTEVSPEVAHDPAEAVFGGADGMSVIVPMLPVIADLLRPGGVFGLEHDESTSVAVVSAAAGIAEITDVAAHDDLTGRPRFMTGRRRD
ncbi:peptide chain release factor N(5)-glutamine methyltransferase [Gordonia sp. CPCC 205515]